MKILKHSRFVFGLLIISLMLMVVIAAPSAYAGGDSNPPVPVTPPKNGKFQFPKAGNLPINQPWGIASVKLVCSNPAVVPSGVATVTGGQLVLNEKDGALWFCNTAVTPAAFTFIIGPPILTPAATNNHYGLAAKGTLVAVDQYNTFGNAGGVWTCTWSSTLKTCIKQSAFIPISSVFCGTMPLLRCWPFGLAFDNSYNLWYTDPANAMVVELTKASGYLTPGTRYAVNPTVGLASPVGIVIDSSNNQYVVDGDNPIIGLTLGACAGNVYENGVVLAKAGDSLGAITIHGKDLYVTVTDDCGFFPFPFVGDLSTFTIVGSPFIPQPSNPIWPLGDGWPGPGVWTGLGVPPQPFNMYGLSTALYFTDNIVLGPPPNVWLA